MLDYLFLTFIAPLEAGMRLALDYGHQWTGSWGMGLIFMSLCVNIVLLPLYHLAETWQEAERRVQHRMADKLAEIRAVFRGQERYAMMRTLYRQNGYHPIFAVRTSFGFLIQVPFFFAAYHFLSHYEPLRHVAFGPLADLAAPDGLLAIGGLAVNVLPILMTVINVVSALVYTHRLTRKDKIQLYGIAALFLVLLYTAAAGLVFYWTCNNIFSLLKNIVYEKFKLLDHGLGDHTAVPVHTQRHSAKTYPNFEIPQKAFPLFFTLLAENIFIISALPLAFHFSLNHFDVRTGQIIIAAIIIFFSAASIVTRYLYQKKHDYPCPKHILILTIACFGIQLFWAMKGANMSSSKASLGLALPALVIAATNSMPLIRSCRWNIGNSKTLSITALCSIMAYVCWYMPVMLFISDPDFFDFKFAPIAASATWILMIFIACIYIFLKTKETIADLFIYIICATFALSSIIYIFVFSNKYGLLTGPFFQFAEKLDDFHIIAADYAIIFSSLIFAILLLKTNKTHILSAVFKCFFITVSAAATFILLTQYPSGDSKSISNENSFPGHHKQLFAHSRHGINVTVFMLDMFSGGHMKKILSEYPELKDELDGFIWYPDTVAVGAATILSVPSLIAGEELAPHKNMAHDDKSMTLLQRIHRSQSSFFNKLKQDRFSIALIDPNWLDPDLAHAHFPEETIAIHKLDDNYIYAFERTLNKGKYTANAIPFFPIFVGLFNIAPENMKKHIYRNGGWLYEENSLSYQRSMNEFAALESYSRFSYIIDSGNTFRFICNELTHIPWHMDIVTCLPTQADPYPATKGQQTRVDGVFPEHYYAEVCALKSLIKYIQWLKLNGIYDNTQIIITSDHESFDSLYLDPIFDEKRPGRPHSLLLVKNRAGHGPLELSDDLMASSDVRQIIENDLYKMNDNNSLPWKDPKRVRWHALGDWRRGPDSDKNFSVDELWKVTGTMFKRENWERVK